MGRKLKYVACSDDVVISKEISSGKDASGNEKSTCTRKDTFPLEIWDMNMDYMDLETLFTMSLVSTEMKALADVKMLKMKSKIEGIFVNIDEVLENYYIGPPHLNKVMMIKTLNIAKDENDDLVCHIERAYIIRMKVVQHQHIATIKLYPAVQKLPEALDDTKEDQIVEVQFNMWMSDENTSKLEMSWSKSSKIKLVLNKANGSLVQTVQNGISEIVTTFTQVPDNWPHLVRGEAGLVSRLHVTNVKLRLSRRKVVEMKNLIPRLRDAILRLPVTGKHLAFPDYLLGMLSPCQALEVGKADLVVLNTSMLGEFPVMDAVVDHQDIIEYMFERVAGGGGIVLNQGVDLWLVNRDRTMAVKYFVVKTLPSSVCLVSCAEQLRVIENEEQLGIVDNAE